MGFDTINEEINDAITPGQARKDWKAYEKQSADSKNPKPMPGATADALTNSDAKQAFATHDAKQRGHRFSLAANHFEIPEQVVGSRHAFAMPLPLNIDANGRRAWIYVQVHGESLAAKTPSFEAASIMAGADAAAASARAVELEFAPARPGEFPALVVVRGEWDDGHVEERITRVTAKARLIDQVPSTKPASTSTAPEHLHAPAPLAPVKTLDAAIDLIKNSNTDIAERRADGVSAVEQENAKFKAPPTPPHGWELLAELAVTLTSAALSGLAGPQIGKMVSRSIATLGLKAGEKQIEEAIGKGAEDVIKETTTSSLKPPGGKKNEESEDGTAQVDTTVEQAVSDDPVINFFGSQQGAIHTTRTNHDNGMIALKDRMVSEHGVDNAAAIGGLLAVNDALRALATVAAKKQAAYTANQFAAFKSQAALGSETISTEAGKTTVTRFDRTREDAGRIHEARADGVLDVEIVGATPDDVRPVTARMFGLSRATANRFLVADLASAGVPMTLRWGYRAIYRDEAGRVRIENWGGAAHAEKEVQSIALAEAVVGRIIEKSLKTWGIKTVESNDIGG